MGKLNVMIIGNSALARETLSRAVEATGLGLVGYAVPGASQAVEILRQEPADAVLSGFFPSQGKALASAQLIREEHPEVLPLVVLYAGERGNAAELVRAREEGALDFLFSPPLTDPGKCVETLKSQLQGLFTQLLTRIYTSGSFPQATSEPKPVPSSPVFTSAGPVDATFQGADVVVMASSTGGTDALETIFRKLAPELKKPFLVVQHMPPDLTKNFARSLQRKCLLPAKEAEEGETVRAGHILIAPGGYHMAVRRCSETGVAVRLETSPPVHGLRPAADVLFHSVATAYRGKKVLAVILTGMGCDGTSGVREMKNFCHCYCLTQSEKTSLIYGMPKSVVEAGLSDAVEDLDTIAYRILEKL